MNIDILNAVISLVTGLLGGVIVTIVGHFLTRKRRAAEIKKIEAETDKIRAETQKMLKEVKGLSATVRDRLEGEERILYNSSQSCSRYDFQDVEGRVWSSEEQKNVGPKGLGILTVEEGGILNIQRTNTEGRFEVWLHSYKHQDTVKDYLQKNELIAGERILRVNCEAKAVDSQHRLRFVIKDKATGKGPHRSIKLAENEWTPISFQFRVSPAADCQLRIDDLDVSHAPSSVQIRDLVVAEPVSQS